jgi:hypothetical protein
MTTSQTPSEGGARRFPLPLGYPYHVSIVFSNVRTYIYHFVQSYNLSAAASAEKPNVGNRGGEMTVSSRSSSTANADENGFIWGVLRTDQSFVWRIICLAEGSIYGINSAR